MEAGAVRRRHATLFFAIAATVAVSTGSAACGGGPRAGSSGSAGGAGATDSTGFPAPFVDAPRTVASRSIFEADSIAGLPLGATKDQAAAVLGPPTTITQEEDSKGKFETHRWQLSGSRGLALSFRRGSRFSPGLTDWTADIYGPATAGGVQVGDAADKVVAAYGPLTDFCCKSKAGGVERGGGRLAVIVPDGTQKAETMVGGDPKAWMRTFTE